MFTDNGVPIEGYEKGVASKNATSEWIIVQFVAIAAGNTWLDFHVTQLLSPRSRKVDCKKIDFGLG